MQREIKFRIWDTKNSRWFQGATDDKSRSIGIDAISLFGETIILGEILRDQNTDEHISLDRLNDLIAVQYTGLKDKKGVPIYEGDIVKNERGEIGVITFVNGAFISVYQPPYDWDAMEKYDGLLDRQEVLGNIYENPNLIPN